MQRCGLHPASARLAVSVPVQVASDRTQNGLLIGLVEASFYRLQIEGLVRGYARTRFTYLIVVPSLLMDAPSRRRRQPFGPKAICACQPVLHSLRIALQLAQYLGECVGSVLQFSVRMRGRDGEHHFYCSIRSQPKRDADSPP